MSREIKFRCWSEKNGNMFKPMIMPGSATETSLNDLFNSKGEVPEHWTRDTDIVWEQYTGLKDKNGVEIYEGDCFEDDEDGSVNWVEYDAFFAGFTTTDGKGSGWWDPRDLARYASDYEVIGNIHEHPELLKEEYGRL